MQSVGTPLGPLVLIADPTQGRGSVGVELPGLVDALHRRGLGHRLVEVRGAAEAERAAGDALDRGDRYLAAVGGDAIAHAVVNALLDEGRPGARDAVLAVVPAGAPSDLVKTFGLPVAAAMAVDHLVGDGVFAIDAGKVVATTSEGEFRTRYFLNIAEVGLGAAVVWRTHRLPPGLGRARRFIGFWLATATSRHATATLTGDRRTWEGRLHDVIVANCQYQGDGMRLSPKSWPDDGYLEVMVMTGPKADSFTMIPKTYLGEHLPHPNIVEYKSKRLQVETSRPLLVHADGEIVGTTPATFEVLPTAVRLKI